MKKRNSRHFDAQETAAENGYLHFRQFEDGGDACIAPLMFTAAILYGLSDFSYEDRWCYKSVEAAKEALDAWDGTGEPEGWHRHPMTGRRRENGVEYINF